MTNNKRDIQIVLHAHEVTVRKGSLLSRGIMVWVGFKYHYEDYCHRYVTQGCPDFT